MSLPVLVTERAHNELDDAYRWWAKHRSSEQANRWYNEFLVALESLADDANRWAVARENDNFPYEIRELHFGLARRPTHRAVFTIRPESVLVLTIQHVSQRELTSDDLP